MTRATGGGAATGVRPGLGRLAAAVLALSAAGCGGDGAEEPAPPPEAAPDPSAASLPPARYLTLVGWAGAGGRPAGALWLENRTGAADSLRRRYRGWTVGGDSARRVLLLDDGIAARAAAWRPVPGPGLSLSVDTRSRLTGLRVAGGRIRLRIGRELASWRGARGERQRLAGGRIRSAGDSAAAVTVVVLRFEHLAGDPGRLGPARALLLADASGGGILVLDQGVDRPWSRGWSWGRDGRVRRLGRDALPDSTPGGGPWSFEVPGEEREGVRVWEAAAEGGAPSAGPARGEAEPEVAPASATIGGSAGAPRAGGFLLRGPGSGRSPGAGAGDARR